MGRVQRMVKNNPLILKNATEVNKEGYKAFAQRPEEAYLKLLLTNTCGNTFYESDNSQALQSHDLHEKMAAQDPEYMAKALVYARNEGFMRLQPTLGLAYLAYAPDKSLFKSVFDKVIKTPADLADFLSLMKMIHKTEGSSRIKKVIGEWLTSNISEYWAMKYNGRGRGYNLTDIIRLTHPIAKTKEQNALFDYLANNNQESLVDLRQLAAVERLRREANTLDENTIIDLIEEARLHYEVVTSVIKPTPKVWKVLSRQMPTFALLRHLNTLYQHNAVDEDYIASRFTPEAIHRSKILPFRFVSAFKALGSSPSMLKDILRLAIEEAVNNMPMVYGKTAIFLDRSGSMSGDLIETASLYALSLMRRTQNAFLWLFNTSLHEFPYSRIDSVLTQVGSINAQGGTNAYLPFERLQSQCVVVDQIILITDEQQNAGDHVMIAFETYRQQVNPDVKLFIINVGSYSHTLFDSSDPNIFFIHGFGDSVVKYVSMMANGLDSLVTLVRQGEYAQE